MRRQLATVSLIALLAASCTGTDAETTTTLDTSTTTELPAMTTLPPASTSTTTEQPPATTTTTTLPPPPENECVVEPYASITIVDYTQGCTVLDMVLLAEEEVDPTAIDAMADRVHNMLLTRPDLIASLQEAGIEGRTVGQDQRITSLPEFEDLYDQYPGYDWNRYGRSFPGTTDIPVFAGSEENLLCLDGDRYEGEDDFVRWFALTIKRFGLDVVDTGTSNAIGQAYGRAIAAGLWENTLAEINADEYWMEGVQSFFDANLENTEEDREPNSSHNYVNTREELAEYDPTLYAIAESVFGDTDWRPTCG